MKEGAEELLTRFQSRVPAMRARPAMMVGHARVITAFKPSLLSWSGSKTAGKFDGTIVVPFSMMIPRDMRDGVLSFGWEAQGAS